jgi:hypothetical protein
MKNCVGKFKLSKAFATQLCGGPIKINQKNIDEVTSEVEADEIRISQTGGKFEMDFYQEGKHAFSIEASGTMEFFDRQELSFKSTDIKHVCKIHYHHPVCEMKGEKDV